MIQKDTRTESDWKKVAVILSIGVFFFAAVLCGAGQFLDWRNEQLRTVATLIAAKHSPESCAAIARFYANFRILEEEARIEGKPWPEADRTLDALAFCPAGAVAREIAAQIAPLAASEILNRQKTSDARHH